MSPICVRSFIFLYFPCSGPFLGLCPSSCPGFSVPSFFSAPSLFLLLFNTDPLMLLVLNFLGPLLHFLEFLSLLQRSISSSTASLFPLTGSFSFLAMLSFFTHHLAFFFICFAALHLLTSSLAIHLSGRHHRNLCTFLSPSNVDIVGPSGPRAARSLIISSTAVSSTLLFYLSPLLIFSF